MTKLFVDKSVEIHASVQRVWDILTSPVLTVEWASEFTRGGPKLHLESDWTVGSRVTWKDKRGRVMVDGNVTAAVPQSLLRYTVFDVEGPKPAIDPEDGIEFKLTERDGNTVLWVAQGDFSKMPDGAKYRDLSADIWERALARIKRMAERRG